jgi:hypothetical protein
MDGAAALTSSLRHSGRCTILYSCDSCLLQPCEGGGWARRRRRDRAVAKA